MLFRCISKRMGISYLILIYLIYFFTPTLEESVKTRYVVRENSPVGMDCKHKFENVTSIRWEYISTQEITSKIIYDSQKNKTESGFEVSCPRHRTSISTCIKLLQARKEDSGKYNCYVKEGNGDMPDSKFLILVVEIDLVVRGPKHQTMVVNNGDSVILPCEHNLKNLTRARWSHVSLQGVMTYQLYYMDWTEATNNNYKGLCKSHQLSCNLKILQANKKSAGRYICMVGEPLEFEEEYGMFQMTYFIEIQLVVGELQCNENTSKDLTLIGENDCYGIEADVLNLKCSFNYFGNISYNLLHLSWIEKNKFNSLEKKLNSSLINHEVKDEINKISIQTNLSVAYEMQNSIFQCVLDESLAKPCQLRELRIQYVKNTTAVSPPMYSNDLRNIKCSANKSENVQCSYYWVHEIAGAMVENPYVILPVENMNSPGNYTCIGKCHLRQNACIIIAMEFEVIRRSEVQIIETTNVRSSQFILGLFIGFLVTFCLINILAYFLGFRFKYKKEKVLKDKDTPLPKHGNQDDDRFYCYY